jgi:acetyl esterase/lipase
VALVVRRAAAAHEEGEDVKSTRFPFLRNDHPIFARAAMVAMLPTCLFWLVPPAHAARLEPTWSHLAYGPHWRQRLDIYLPPDLEAPAPAVVYIHGGGWRVGDKADAAIHAPALLARGLIVVGINYRFSQNATFPAQIHDCKAAIRFLRAGATTYMIDPDRIGVFGKSAGGHLAALLGTSGGVAELEGDVGGNLDCSSRVQAVADHFGQTDLFAMGEYNPDPDSVESLLIGHPIMDIIEHIDDPDYAPLVALVESAGSISHVTVDDPPFLIAHGTADTVVPPDQSTTLHDLLLDAGVQTTLRLVEGEGHGLPSGEDEIVYDWLADHLRSAVVGDITGDGVVDVNDLLALLAAWGDCPGGSDCPADLNGDGVVNTSDLLALLAAWAPRR